MKQVVALCALLTLGFASETHGMNFVMRYAPAAWNVAKSVGNRLFNVRTVVGAIPLVLSLGNGVVSYQRKKESITAFEKEGLQSDNLQTLDTCVQKGQTLLKEMRFREKSIREQVRAKGKQITEHLDLVMQLGEVESEVNRQEAQLQELIKIKQYAQEIETRLKLREVKWYVMKYGDTGALSLPSTNSILLPYERVWSVINSPNSFDRSSLKFIMLHEAGHLASRTIRLQERLQLAKGFPAALCLFVNSLGFLSPKIAAISFPLQLVLAKMGVDLATIGWRQAEERKADRCAIRTLSAKVSFGCKSSLSVLENAAKESRAHDTAFSEEFSETPDTVGMPLSEWISLCVSAPIMKLLSVAYSALPGVAAWYAPRSFKKDIRWAIRDQDHPTSERRAQRIDRACEQLKMITAN